MKIVNIMGGLGNQMFQYAFALSLKEKFPEEEVLIDTSHYGHIFFNHYKGANLHNGFEIDKVFPNAKLEKASAKQLMKVSWYMPNYVLSRIIRRILPSRKSEFIQPLSKTFVYMPEVYERKGDCYYEGIWESVRYLEPIRSVVQKTYSHPIANGHNKEYIEQLECENSVGVHIRRGDYLNSPELMNICDLDYYKKAINEITKDGVPHAFYIFSNDIAWCESNICPLCENHKVIMVTENKCKDSCWDMFLMTHCKDLIIANSSFSWWGAFLNNRGGRVVSPKKWFNRDAEFEIWLDEWIRI